MDQNDKKTQVTIVLFFLLTESIKIHVPLSLRQWKCSNWKKASRT